MIGFAVRRPVAVCAAAVALALAGAASVPRIPVRMHPSVELPQLGVTALVDARSPAATEALVTAPLEAAVSKLRGVERVASTSQELGASGVARLDVRFARGTDMHLARMELTEALAHLRDELPANVHGPYVAPHDPLAGADRFLTLMLTGARTSASLREHAERIVVPALRRVGGVADAVVEGGGERSVRVALNGDRAAALGLDAASVVAALADDHVAGDAGVVRSASGRVLPVTLSAGRASPSRLSRVAVRNSTGGALRVSDVARVFDAVDDEPVRLRVDGLPAVVVSLRPTDGASAFRVAADVRARIAELHRDAAGRGMRLLVADDATAVLHARLARWWLRACIVVIVAMVCVAAAMRSVVAAALVAVVVVLAALGALATFPAIGISLDVSTLAALVVGLCVSAHVGIVVVSHVLQRIRRGERVRDAAERGARAAVRPVVGASVAPLTLVIPALVLRDDLRAYAVPVASVLALTTLVGLLVSLTVVPAVAARVLRERGIRRSPPSQLRRRLLQAAMRVFPHIVERPRRALAVAAAVAVATIVVALVYLARGDWPIASTAESTLAVSVELSRGESIERTDAVARHLESVVRSSPPAVRVARYVTRVSPSHAKIDVTFVPRSVRTRGPLALFDRLTAESRRLGGVRARVAGSGVAFLAAGPSPPTYAIAVLGYRYDTVRDLADAVGARLRRYPRVRDVDTDAAAARSDRARTTEIVVRLDRARLTMHGLAVDDAVAAVSDATGAGTRLAAASAASDGTRVPVTTSRSGVDVDDHALPRIVVRPAGDRGAIGVALAHVAAIEWRDQPARIERVDQQYRRLVTYEFRGPPRLGDAVHAEVLRSAHVPPGHRLARVDARPSLARAGQTVFVGAVASGALLFVLCALLFESLRLPLCVVVSPVAACAGAIGVAAAVHAVITRESALALGVAGALAIAHAVTVADCIGRIPDHLRAGARRRAVLRAVLRGALAAVLALAAAALAVVVLVALSDDGAAAVWRAWGAALLGALLGSVINVVLVAPALCVTAGPRAPGAL